MNILLRGKGCKKSAKVVGECIPITVRRQPQYRDTVIVRWGSTRYAVEGSEGTINSREAICKATQKITALQILGEGGIAVPKIWLELTDDITFPCLSRQQIHRQGRDIVVVETAEVAEQELEQGRFLVELLGILNEYRIHIINGEPVKLFRKVKRVETADSLIRSARCGWSFHNVDYNKPWLTPLLEKAVQTANILGLYFTAIDILHTMDHRFVVLEANSAPGIADNASVRTIYLEAIKQWVGERYEME